MAQVSQVRDANIIDAKTKDSILPPLQSLALIVKGRDRIDRHVANCRMNLIPGLASWTQAMKNDRAAARHPNVAVRSVVMAGCDNMLRQRRPGQIISSMRIRENARSFRRRDLESRMAKPLQSDEPWIPGIRHPADDLYLMTEAECDPRKQDNGQQQPQPGVDTPSIEACLKR